MNSNRNITSITECVSAIHNNDIEIFKENLQDIDINQSISHELRTLLNLAIDFKRKDFVQILIDNHASVNIFNEYDGAPLLQAVKNNSIEIVELLIHAGADVNFIAPKIMTHTGGSALHVASRSGFINIAKFLLDNGANINAHTILDKYTPLCLAIINKHKNIFDLLITHEAKINTEGEIESSLQLALESGVEYFVLKVLQFFNENQKDHTWVVATEFVLAIVNDNLEKAKELYEKLTIDINEINWGELKMVHLAAMHKNLDMMKCLVSWNADLTIKDRSYVTSALDIAAESNDSTMILYLVSRCRMKLINYFNDTSNYEFKRMLNDALRCAVFYGHLDSVKVLIDAGADKNYSVERLPVLSLSVKRKHFDITNLLLSIGAKTHSTHKINNQRKLSDQITPFHVALNDGNLDLAISFIIVNGCSNPRINGEELKRTIVV